MWSATVAIAMGYVVSGAIAWIVLKFLAIALIPAIFDLTKHKLMTMPWFVRAYEKVMAFHHYAHQIVAPYKEAAAAVLRQWRMRAAAVTRRVPGLAHLAARFASRKRASGRPAMPSEGRAGRIAFGRGEERDQTILRSFTTACGIGRRAAAVDSVNFAFASSIRRLWRKLIWPTCRVLFPPSPPIWAGLQAIRFRNT